MLRRALLPLIAVAIATLGACAPATKPDGSAIVPPEAAAVDTSHPDHVIGNGTPASCTSAAVVATIALGGEIVFNCGPNPITITLAQTANVMNNTGPEIVIDGGGKVTLSGGGAHRILYMNTCDQSLVWLTSHCQDQDAPHLTVQNLTFVDGNSTGQTTDGGGGGAIFVRGGRFKIVNSTFKNNTCEQSGPDIGGGAVRVLSQFQNQPVFVTNSVFDGNWASNGGALSSIGVSWVVLNTTITNNRAVGSGANPAQSGTPGGGSGGGIYLDGNLYSLRVVSSTISDNHANEGGGAVFFVSNDRTGSMRLEHSTLHHNPSDGFETAGYPGIFYLGSGPPQVIDSSLG